MDFPQDEYSHLIDQQFSFSNRVDFSNNNNFPKCKGNIMLEPRLQEYMKKANYYKSNNIKPVVAPEKEFQITKYDLEIINSYVNGKRDMYVPNNKYQKKYLKENRYQKTSFSSKELLKDRRIPEIEKTKHTYETPINRGMFDSKKGCYDDKTRTNTGPVDFRDIYEMQHTKINKGGFDPNSYRYNPRNDSLVDQPGVETHNRYDSQYHVGPTAEQMLKISKSKYEKGGIHDTYTYLEKDFCDNRYGNMNADEYLDTSEYDTKNKIIMPNIRQNIKKDLNVYNYVMTNLYDENDQCKDNNFEMDMINGMPVHTKKSYGYRNPEEHYYDYIDNEFQNAYNSVLPFPFGGESTRLGNKKMAKQKYVREIY